MADYVHFDAKTAGTALLPFTSDLWPSTVGFYHCAENGMKILC
jgi:hypothetical protein